MLADVLEASGRLCAGFDLEPRLAFHPPEAVRELIHLAPPGFCMQPQRGPGLGERMANAFAESAASGAPFALLRGSDSPGLGRAHIESALEQLEAGAEIVLTPDHAGGYAMVALRSPHPEIFDVPMSTNGMLGQTVAVVKELGLKYGLTPTSFDLDHVADLARLDSLSLEETSDLCPRTVEAISLLRETGVLPVAHQS
jgi:glycosyltransferase A (GT-A) superfamily protein (DUF2064 family)